MRKLLKFASTLAEELPQVVGAWTGRIEQGLGGFIAGAFDAVHGPLRAQLEALAPASFAADLDEELFDPITASLDGLTPSSIAGPAIDATLGEAKEALDGVVAALQNVKASVAAAHQQALAGLTAVSPRSLQADLQEAYAPITGALGELDLGTITDELIAQFQRIGGQAADVLQAVLDALKAMVAAIPSGIEGVSVEASAEF